MNNELVKNSNLLLASRFFGTLSAESFTVRRRCNRLTCSFCDNKQGKIVQVNANYIVKEVIQASKNVYNFRVLGPFNPRKESPFISCSCQNVPCIKLLPGALKKKQISTNSTKLSFHIDSASCGESYTLNQVTTTHA